MTEMMEVEVNQVEEEFLLTYKVGGNTIKDDADREKIACLLQKYQNLSSDAPLSSATRCFSVDPGSASFLSELFSELENIDMDDMTREGTAKNFSDFLVDLTEAVPEVVLANINHLLPHLDGECFTLRKSVLAVVTVLIERHLVGEDLNDDEKGIRDGFLQHLEDHIHDKNAFVRAKVLQLWTKLVETKALPLSRLRTTLPLIIGRLADKASTVRKAAVQFLTIILHLRVAHEFAEQFLAVLPQVSAMLRQQQTSDVLEAIDFIITCNEIGIDGSKVAFWECCRLIWSKEQPIRDAVLKAVHRLFLSPEGTEEKSKSLSMAKSLISLTLEADLSQLTSLEEIVSEIFKRRLLPQTVYRLLWEYFAMRFPGGNSYAESKAALKLLGMIAQAEKSVIQDNLDTLIEFGLGERAVNDFELAADACYVMEKLSLMPKTKAEEALRLEPYRLNDDHVLFIRLRILIVDGYSRLDDPMWTPMTERALRVIFGLANHPNDVAAVILQDVLKRFNETLPDGCPNGLLIRLLTLIGQTALQSFINLDVSVCRELKRRALLNEELKIKTLAGARKLKKEETSPSQSTARQGKRKLPVKTPRSKVSTVSTTVTPTIDIGDDELNAMVGANADDQEYEFVNHLCEEELLADRSVLGQLSKFVLMICQNPHKYQSEEIQTAASLALSKLMLVSSKFAEENIQLFFTLMDRGECAAVRANMVIAVGDLSFRFPNIVEPWTATIYRRLHDSDLNVRLNCLLILNHLILNDMIKPKGFVADIAMCTLDDNGHVANLAKKFFAEYSEKANALYNLLPDIISRLSDPESSIKFDKFKSVLKFLFSLIRKERQFEGLVEKLCQRFLLTNSVDQWRRLSYCLTLPTYNERCLKKLLENIKCFATKLGDDETYCDFVTVLNVAKKACKQESKNLVDEFEEKIMTLHRKYDIAHGGCSAAESMDIDIKPHREPAKTPKRRRRATIDSPECSQLNERSSQKSDRGRKSDE